MQNVSSLDILSLFGKEQFNDIQKRLSKITRLGFVTVNYRGDPITDYTGFSPFCGHFRGHETLKKNCMASDAMSSIRAAIAEKPLIYLCPCGLTEIAIPILVNGTYLGGFLCGQARCIDPPGDILRMTPATEPKEFAAAMSNAQVDFEKLSSYSYQHFKDIADLVNLVITLLCENKIHQIEHEKELRDQINTAAFLEIQTQTLAKLLQGTAYREALQASAYFVEALFKLIPENSGERMRTLTALTQGVGDLVETAGKIEYIKLYPLTMSDANSSQATELWLAQWMDYYFRQNKIKTFSILEPVFQYMNQHIAEELTLGLLVEHCNISQSYLSRLFRNCFQLSVTDYIHLRKLQQAKQMLLREKDSAVDIAYRLGYNEYTYFSKVFKKYEGFTVNEYKRIVLNRPTEDGR